MSSRRKRHGLDREWDGRQGHHASTGLLLDEARSALVVVLAVSGHELFARSRCICFVLDRDASASVRQPIPDLALSNMSRTALWAWTKTAAQDLAEEGITVNLAAPGLHATDRLLERGVTGRTGLATNGNAQRQR